MGKHTDGGTRLQLLFDELEGLGLIVLDAEGCTTSCNQAAAHLLAIDPREILGKTTAFLHEPAHLADGHAWAALQAARENGRSNALQWVPRRNGPAIFASVGIVALRSECGAFLGYGITLREASTPTRQTR